VCACVFLSVIWSVEAAGSEKSVQEKSDAEGAGKSAPGKSLAASSAAAAAANAPLQMLVPSPRETGGSGLTCERDGFFIQGFETSKTVDSLGSQVPVSRALCTTPALSVQQPSVFARSINCGSSRPQSRGSSLVCPSGQFLFGFEDWRANFVKDRLLPVGPVRCCNMQLQQLDALYDVEPCKCITASTVTGGNSRSGGAGIFSSSKNAVTCPRKDQLIVGFPLSRYGFDNRPLPTSPTKCCEACVTKKRYRNDQQCMIEFNNCSGNGRCEYGACVCFRGYSGTDCSYKEGSRSGGGASRWWTDVSPIVLVILVTGAGLSLGVVIANLIAIVTWYRQNGDDDDVGTAGAAAAAAAAAARRRTGADRQRAGGAEGMRQRLLNDIENSDDDDTDEDDELDSDFETDGDGDFSDGADLESGDEEMGSTGSPADAAAAAAAAAAKGARKLKAKIARQRAKREERIENLQLLDSDSFPHDYLCPITQEVMVDPVIASDGHSYERKAIKKWFKHSLRSPKTGALLSHPGVTRNFTLRAAINTLVREIIDKQARDFEAVVSGSASVSGHRDVELVVAGERHTDANGDKDTGDGGVIELEDSENREL